MPDPGNPNQEPRPKFTPDPNKSPFDRPRAASNITEPDLNYVASDKQDIAPTTDDETLFRAKGIQLAQMETELEATLENNFPRMGMRKIANETFVVHEREGFRMTTSQNLGRGYSNGHVSFTAEPKEMDIQGVKTRYILEVDPAFDQEDLSDEDNILRSRYFFSPDGKCAKKERFFTGKRVIDSPQNDRDATMTMSDLEVAEKSLATLLVLLKPQEKPTE